MFKTLERSKHYSLYYNDVNKSNSIICSSVHETQLKKTWDDI
jgi:hypothetical protein